MDAESEDDRCDLDIQQLHGLGMSRLALGNITHEKVGVKNRGGYVYNVIGNNDNHRSQNNTISSQKREKPVWREKEPSKPKSCTYVKS